MPKTIVWIEDDTDIIDPVVRPLERAGYRFERLRTAKEALDRLDIIRGSDLIVLDLILPPGGMDRKFSCYPGLDLLQELREQHGITQPVVVLSVVRNEETFEKLRALGVADVITKAVLPSELKGRVQKVLEANEQ